MPTLCAECGAVATTLRAKSEGSSNKGYHRKPTLKAHGSLPDVDIMCKTRGSTTRVCPDDHPQIMLFHKAACHHGLYNTCMYSLHEERAAALAPQKRAIAGI
eukprot:TRINITY_DN17084_c0_g1_i1.p3 TRINITY_DN17084_c0_g1~~TRINITY_DN17084_c0_g1_i1.p3  ORF type:complete len:102 (+),score=5.69 TRINITY_DN17084_c0_g1_i1:100-405(+)